MYDKESLQELEERIRALEPDCYSEERLALMDAYTALSRIVGEAVSDALVDEIFSRFCMGQ